MMQQHVSADWICVRVLNYCVPITIYDDLYAGIQPAVTITVQLFLF